MRKSLKSKDSHPLRRSPEFDAQLRQYFIRRLCDRRIIAGKKKAERSIMLGVGLLAGLRNGL